MSTLKVSEIAMRDKADLPDDHAWILHCLCELSGRVHSLDWSINKQERKEIVIIRFEDKSGILFTKSQLESSAGFTRTYRVI